MGEGPILEEESRKLLTSIIDFFSARPPRKHPPVLVGGWAVWHYTRYAMSVDIDLVLNSRDRHSLLQWLKISHDMTVAKPHMDGWRGAEKRIQGTDRPLVVDLATYGGRYPFQGRSERLDFNIVESHNVMTQWEGQTFRLPTRSLLILFKTKAAYDRGVRRRQADATSRVKDKWYKDQADILALLDPAIVRQPLEYSLLFEQLDRLPFLRETLAAIPRTEPALQRANILPDEAERRIENLLARTR